MKYSFSKRAFQTKAVHMKIKKLLNTKKYIEIPSNPKEKLRFNKRLSNSYVTIC